MLPPWLPVSADQVPVPSVKGEEDPALIRAENGVLEVVAAAATAIEPMASSPTVVAATGTPRRRVPAIVEVGSVGRGRALERRRELNMKGEPDSVVVEAQRQPARRGVRQRCRSCRR